MSDPSVAEPRWLSVHLFHGGAGIYGRESDAVLREAVAPIVRRLAAEGDAERFFFVRYGEWGPHVRLRVAPAPGREARVRATLLGEVRDRFPGVDGTDGAVPDSSARTAAAGVTAIRWIPYDPETERYGGPSALRVAEDVFHVSSTSALELLAESVRDDRSNRLGKALLAAAVLVHAFCGTREAGAAFAAAYTRTYLRSPAFRGQSPSDVLQIYDERFTRQRDTLGAYVEEGWRRMETAETLTDALDAYRLGLCAQAERLQALTAAGQVERGGRVLGSWQEVLAAVVPSYLHMTNNRLGVSIPDETYLAHLLGRVLGAPAVAVV
jgi:thiopeptide-type bacteriocin biosynthesis protein